MRQDQSQRGIDANGPGRCRWRNDLSDDSRSLGQHGVAYPQRFSVYGSRATVAPYGFVLAQSRQRVLLDPESPNVVAPHKRPFHSIIAGFVQKDGQPLMTFGNMGGSVQPETHAQHMVNLIDLGMNVQMTTDAARFTHSQNGNTLSLETNLFNLVGSALTAKGHNVRPSTAEPSAAIRGSCSRGTRQ